jgi:hypothetical protein
MGNMLRTFELPQSEIENSVELDGILSAIMFGLRATYHTTLQATPTQLVFGRDAILNVKFEADWNQIRNRKQEIINKNNTRENAKRIPYKYQVGRQVLLDVSKTTQSKYAKNPFEGPYTILRVNDNGTIAIQKGPVIETVNIRNVKPYKE